LAIRGYGLPAGPATRGAPTSWGVYRLRLGPPVGRLGDSVLATDGSLHPKGYTRHEVTRQAIVFVGWQVSDLVLSHVGTCDELVILWRS
jgi:hypothetical protein